MKIANASMRHVVETAYVKHLGGITSRARQQAVVEVLDVGIALDPGDPGVEGQGWAWDGSVKK